MRTKKIFTRWTSLLAMVFFFTNCPPAEKKCQSDETKIVNSCINLSILGVWPPVPPDVGDTKESANQVVIFNNDSIAKIQSIPDDISWISFSEKSSQLSSLQVGDKIIAPKTEHLSYSFIRKVKEVDLEQNIIYLEHAALEEGFENIDFSSSSKEAKSFRSLNDKVRITAEKNGSFLIEFAETLTLGDGIEVSGSVKAVPSYDFRFQTKMFKLQNFRFVTGLDVEKEIGVNVKLKTLINKEWPVDLAFFRFAPIPIGGTPLTITPVVKLRLELSVNGEFGVETKVVQSNSYEAGVEFVRDEGWKKIQSSKKDTTFVFPAAYGKGEVKANLGPRIDFLLMNVSGMYAEFFGFAKAEVGYSASCDIESKLTAGFLVNLGVETDILGINVGYEASGILGQEYPIFDKCDLLPTRFLSIKESAITDSSATIHTQLTKTATVRIDYGYAENNLNLTAEDGTITNLSNISLSGLKSNATVYYRVTAIRGDKKTTSGISSFQTKAEPVVATAIKLVLNPTSINENTTACLAKAFLVMSDGSEQVTAATYISGNPIVRIQSNGCVQTTEIANNTPVEITAMAGGFTDKKQLTVVDTNTPPQPTETSIRLTLNPSSINENSTACLAKVVVIMSNGTTKVVTPSSFSSSNTSVATINSSGCVTAKSVSSNTPVGITAIYGKFSDTKTITVVDSYSPPTEVGIRTTLNTSSVNENTSYLCIASSVVVMSDGSTRSVTPYYISSNTSALTINSSGCITTREVNTNTPVSIKTTYKTFSDTDGITVVNKITTPTLVDVELRLSKTSMAENQTAYSVASCYGVYSDGSKIELRGCELSSSNRSVAAVYQDGKVVTGSVNSNTTIRLYADYDGKSDNKSFTVTDKQSLSIISGSSFYLYDVISHELTLLSRTTTDGKTYLKVSVTKTDGSGVKSGGCLEIMDGWGHREAYRCFGAGSYPEAVISSLSMSSGSNYYYVEWHSNEGSNHSNSTYIHVKKQ